MTQPAREHDRFDELAAGHALHALDPPDEQEFAGHLEDCRRCQEAVTGYLEVTAALADSSPQSDAGQPSEQLRDRIMAAASGETGTGAARPARRDGLRPAAPADLAGRRRRRRLRATIASAAAAAVLIAGGAVAGGVLSSGSGPAGPTAGCVHAGSCRQVVLTAAGSSAPAARLIVMGGTAWLVPSGLPADNTARQVYVLWQITGGRVPLPVGSFDVSGHGDRPIRIGSLAVPIHGTWAFAVSLERGRTIPATPSRPVALGQVSS